MERRGVGALTGDAGQVDAVERQKPRADTLDVVCESLGDLVVGSIGNTCDVGRGNHVVGKDGVRGVNRFLPEDVEARAGLFDPRPGRRPEVVVNDGTSPDIDDVSAAFHLLNSFLPMMERVSGVRGRARMRKSERDRTLGKSEGPPRKSSSRSWSMPVVGSRLMPKRVTSNGFRRRGQGLAYSPHPKDPTVLPRRLMPCGWPQTPA